MEEVNGLKLLVERTERNSRLGRLRHRWKGHSQMDKETGWYSGLNLSAKGQEPVAGSCEHIK
jgi:hypothetical protein